MREICQAKQYHPRLKACENTDIEVYIMKNDKEYGICTSCWNKIADKDIGVTVEE